MSFFEENSSEQLRISQILQKIIQKIGKKQVCEVIQLASAAQTNNSTLFQKVIDILLKKRMISQNELESYLNYEYKKNPIETKNERKIDYELREASILMNFREERLDTMGRTSFTMRKKIVEYNSHITIQATRQKIEWNEEVNEFSPYSDIISSNFDKEISLSQIDNKIHEIENEVFKKETIKHSEIAEVKKKKNDNFCFLSPQTNRNEDGQMRTKYEGKKDNNYKCMNFFEFV